MSTMTVCGTLSADDVDRMATVVRGYALERSLTHWAACKALSMPPEVRALFAPGRWTYLESDAVAALWRHDGPLCNAYRRLDKRHAELCSRAPGHDGEHVDGRTVLMRHEGMVDVGAVYVPPVGTPGPWVARRACAGEHAWTACTAACRE